MNDKIDRIYGSVAHPASYPMALTSSAEVKNAWNYTSSPQYIFMAWCLVKHRDNFSLPWSMETVITIQS
jgi:hypothetical protein